VSPKPALGRFEFGLYNYTEFLTGQACDTDRMTVKKPKRPTDPNQLAKSIVDEATRGVQGDAPVVTDEAIRSQMAKLLGRRGGLAGGPARAAALGPKRRTEIAKAAAASRWAKKDKKAR
jgi:hypothetical protein